jgi:glycosyltransferase involved in cell wall biosynthesis
MQSDLRKSIMSEPTVDVVISTNRASPYLREAVGSVLEQSWTGWRLIVVDDGSPTPEFLLDAVRDVPDAVVVRQPASGLPAARNHGIRVGTGQLVAFLDDDDVWHPDRLAAQVEAWRAAPRHVAVYSGGWYMDADGTPFGSGWPAAQTPSPLFLSGEVPLPRIVTLLVRRDVCEAMGGFNETFSLAEDNEFILRLAQRGEMLAVEQALVGYRRHAFNMSGISLEGRLANERLLVMQRAAARANGDRLTARLLGTNLRRLRRTSAPDSLRLMAAAVRARDLGSLGRELAWAGRSAPLPTVAALASRATHVFRAARRPDRRAPNPPTTGA